MKGWFFLFILITGIAAVLRFHALNLRPMHTDEAVHAIKFGRLLEEDYYRYNQNEFHGPTLNYLTLIPAFILSKEKIGEVTEPVLRLVPAVFGVAVLLLLVLLHPRISRPSLIFAAFFMAISPVMIYFSRYYIQEMLLVFFTYAALFSLFRLFEKREIAWGIWCGVWMGFMMATKETWIIAMPGMVLSCFAFQSVTEVQGNRLLRTAALIVLPALLVSSLFYTSFLSHPRGLIDSMTAFVNYAERAGLDGTGQHIQPWYYYLKLLVYSGHGVIFTEIFILGTGLAGLIYATGNRNDPEGRIYLGIAVFAGITGLIYSVIPYKTPWNLLTSYAGWIFLSGYGISRAFRDIRSMKLKYAIALLTAACSLHLAYQAYLMNFRHFADSKNPWAYAHTSMEIFRIQERLDNLSMVQPAGKQIYMEIIAEGHDYWPLPWYLRDFPNIGWHDRVKTTGAPAPVILASPLFRGKIMEKIYELPPPGKRYLYMPLFDSIPELRPGVYLEGYVRKDVWDRYVRVKGEK